MKAQTQILGAVGDIGFLRTISESMYANGADWPFERVRADLARADFLFGNMESVMLPPDFPARNLHPKALVCTMPGADQAGALRRAGFDVLNMAANHVLDAGTRGLFNTRDHLRKAGIAVVGVGRTQVEARRLVVVEKAGLRVGFLGYCEPNNCTLHTAGPTHAHYDPAEVIRDVRRHRRSVDALVVSVHADIEFMPTPSWPRREAGRRIAEAGASVVLMHHPHVPQGVERHRGSLIAYSLGNFIFPGHSMPYMAEHGPHTSDSLILLVELSRRGVGGFERIPCVIQKPQEERPVPAAGRERARLLRYFDTLDRMVHDDRTVRRVWRDTVRDFLKGYIGIIRNAPKADTDLLLEDVLPRMLFVAEDRRVMEEAAEMAREHWIRIVAGDNTYQRPGWRLGRR